MPENDEIVINKQTKLSQVDEELDVAMNALTDANDRIDDLLARFEDGPESESEEGADTASADTGPDSSSV